MTKTEFCQEANRANINPNIFGLVINESIVSKYGVEVSGGKVIGIEWFDEWVAEKEWRRGLGEWDAKHLSKVPYVVLKKGRNTYHVAVYRIQAYLRRLLDAQLIAMVKAQKTAK